MTKAMTDVLPCPFCGEATALGSTVDGGVYLDCDGDGCHASPMVVANSIEEAIARWNTRSLPKVTNVKDLIVGEWYWVDGIPRMASGSYELKVLIIASLRIDAGEILKVIPAYGPIPRPQVVNDSEGGEA